MNQEARQYPVFRADMLMELVQLLRDEHPKKKIKGIFNMSTYGELRDTECGTAACAMGWGAYHLPKFKRIYTLTGDDFNLTSEARDKFKRYETHGCTHFTMGFHDGLGITRDEYNSLFDPRWYHFHGRMTMRGVAMEIERFVKRKLKEVEKTGQRVKRPT